MQQFSLTEKQARFKAFLIAYMARNNGLAPSYAEIASGVGFPSKSGVHRMMQSLIDRGHVVTIPGKTRAMRILGDGK